MVLYKAKELANNYQLKADETYYLIDGTAVKYNGTGIVKASDDTAITGVGIASGEYQSGGKKLYLIEEKLSSYKEVYLRTVVEDYLKSNPDLLLDKIITKNDLTDVILEDFDFLEPKSRELKASDNSTSVNPIYFAVVAVEE